MWVAKGRWRKQGDFNEGLQAAERNVREEHFVGMKVWHVGEGQFESRKEKVARGLVQRRREECG